MIQVEPSDYGVYIPMKYTIIAFIVIMIGTFIWRRIVAEIHAQIEIHEKMKELREP